MNAPVASAPIARRFTIAEYHQLTELGFFDEDGRIELINGEIVTMPAKGMPHENCLMVLNRELVQAVGKRAFVRCQSPITLPNDSEPEPDFSIVRVPPKGYLKDHPTPQDVLLAIEISDSSLAYDRDTKLKLYARHGISDYWIFNLIDQVVEAHSQPFTSERGVSGYRIRRLHFSGELLTLPGLPEVQLPIAEAFSHSRIDS